MEDENFLADITARYSKQHFRSCNVLRTFTVTPLRLTFNTDIVEPVGPEVTVTGPCNTPLFSDEGTVCKACQKGWEVNANKFANEDEKHRAMTGEFVLTNEHKDALGEAMATIGRNWKSRLRHAWETGDYTGFNPDHVHLLQQVRNQFGPTWLTKIRAKDLTT